MIELAIMKHCIDAIESPVFVNVKAERRVLTSKEGAAISQQIVVCVPVQVKERDCQTEPALPFSSSHNVHTLPFFFHLFWAFQSSSTTAAAEGGSDLIYYYSTCINLLHQEAHTYTH